jgi:outer membrane assembly lipoprotein YfgL
MSVLMMRRNLMVTMGVVFVAFSSLLGGCSSTGDKPKPTELTPLINTIAVKQVWTAATGKGSADFEIAVVGNEIVTASIDGTVSRLDLATGKTLASYRHDQLISAAVGADSEVTAFVDVRNELIVLRRDGTVAWRQKLPSQTLAAPLVAKGAVFVLSTDQTVRSFDVASGSSLWVSSRTIPSLLLSRAGGMTIEGETLFVALAQGRVAALSTTSGVVRWEQTVITARGANEVEKLTDLIGKPFLVAGDVCVRSFQAGIACVAQQSGRSKWTKMVSGSAPIAVDQKQVIASDRISVVSSFNRDNGDTQFTIDRLKHREVSAAVLLGRSFVLGDELGVLHWLGRDDGAALARMTTDGSAINTAPVLAGKTLIARTQNALYAFVAE